MWHFGGTTDKWYVTVVHDTQGPAVEDLGAVNAGTATCDLDQARNFKVGITGACTLAFSNLTDGRSGFIQVTNDAASPTLAKGTGVTAPGGSITLTAGSGDVNVLQYAVEGTNIRVWPVSATAFS